MVSALKAIGRFLAEDMPADAAELEGIERGYVAFMSWANTQLARTEAETKAGQMRLDEPAMTVRWEGEEFPVASYEDAQAKWNEFRARSGAGASELPRAAIYENGQKVADIAYNGKIQPVRQALPEPEPVGGRASVSKWRTEHGRRTADVMVAVLRGGGELGDRVELKAERQSDGTYTLDHKHYIRDKTRRWWQNLRFDTPKQVEAFAADLAENLTGTSPVKEASKFASAVREPEVSATFEAKYQPQIIDAANAPPRRYRPAEMGFNKHPFPAWMEPHEQYHSNGHMLDMGPKHAAIEKKIANDADRRAGVSWDSVQRVLEPWNKATKTARAQVTRELVLTEPAGTSKINEIVQLNAPGKVVYLDRKYYDFLNSQYPEADWHLIRPTKGKASTDQAFLVQGDELVGTVMARRPGRTQEETFQKMGYGPPPTMEEALRHMLGDDGPPGAGGGRGYTNAELREWIREKFGRTMGGQAPAAALAAHRSAGIVLRAAGH